MTTETTTDTQQPTVYIVMGDGPRSRSAIARAYSGEILEAVYWNEDGTPDWSDAAICDHRGAGGADGYAILADALNAAEKNAEMVGFNISRVR